MTIIQKTIPYFLFAILLFVGSSDVLAQRGQRMAPKERVAQQLKSMTEALGLSDEQVSKVEPILMASMEKQTKLRESMRNGGDRSGIRDKMQAMVASEDELIGVILTEEQLPKLKTWRESQRSARGRRGGPRPGQNNL